MKKLGEIALAASLALGAGACGTPGNGSSRINTDQDTQSILTQTCNALVKRNLGGQLDASPNGANATAELTELCVALGTNGDIDPVKGEPHAPVRGCDIIANSMLSATSNAGIAAARTEANFRNRCAAVLENADAQEGSGQ